jgi:hypothetical protein
MPFDDDRCPPPLEIVKDADFVNKDEAKTTAIEQLICISEREAAEAQ